MPAGVRRFEVPDTLRAFGQLARARRREITGPVDRGDRHQRQDQHEGDAGRGARHPLPGPRDPRQPQQPGRRADSPFWRRRTTPRRWWSRPAPTCPARSRATARSSNPRSRSSPTRSQGHLEGFGSLGGVVAEKLSLADGRAARDRRHRAAGARRGGAASRPRGPDRGARAGRPRARPGRARSRRAAGAHLRRRPRFTLAARGLHQADNATLVWAVVEALGLDRQAAAAALERFALPGGRGELLEQGGLTILNDCYNANPQSLPRRDRDRPGAPERPAAGVRRRDHAGAGRRFAGAPRGDRGGTGGARAGPAGGGRRVRAGARALRRTSWATGWSRRRIRSRWDRSWRRDCRAMKSWC